MVIKVLSEVATSKERKVIPNVCWTKLPNHSRGQPPVKSDTGIITAMWKFGCSLVTRHNLLPGENIALQALDEAGRPLFDLMGTVTWAENCFSAKGYRCEVRFRDGTEAGALLPA